MGKHIKSLLFLVIIALALRASVVEAYRIPSGSMLPTLQIGDHLLVTKFDYALRYPVPFVRKSFYVHSFPDRGDIVVFTRPDNPATAQVDESNKNIIKRVIGLPGEKIEVVNGKVFINEKELHESYAVWSAGGVGLWGPYVVPENHVFVLGDNRDFSKDSRFWHDPYLPVELIKGRAQIIYLNLQSPSRIGSLIR